VLDLLLLLLVTAPGCLYVLGAGRRVPARRRKLRSVAFLSGLALVTGFLASPVAGAADRVLTIHMVQHVVLISVAAPLLAVGRPIVTMLAALPARWRLRLVPWRRRARSWVRLGAGGASWAWAVGLAGLVHDSVVAGWHIPAAYDSAVAHPFLHALEHASFLLTGVTLWSLLLEAARRGHYPAVAAVLFGSMLEMIAIGAALTLSGRPLYLRYAGGGAASLADQQVAGVVMWAYGGMATLVAFAWLFMRWLNQGSDQGAGAAEGTSARPVPLELSVAGADRLGLDRRDGA
jgi:cytochrome c oxidase assembly factor CtaG